MWNASLQASLWIYPWDILDEGVNTALDRARNVAGVSVVKVAVTYHSALLLLPHNPVRRLYAAVEGAAYFHASQEHFPGALKPVRSTFAEARDPLRVIEQAAQTHDLGVRAWMVCCHNSCIGTERQDLAVINALGDHLPYALCPSQPDVQEYLLGLVRALGDFPNLEAIELEALYWLPFEHAWHHPKIGLPLSPRASFLLSLCCCAACATRSGVDQSALIAAIRPDLDAALAGEQDVGAIDRKRLADVAPEL